MRSVEKATRILLERRIATIRAYQRSFPRPQPPETRRHPTATLLWQRYVESAITAQQRDSPQFWRRLNADPRWRELKSQGANACPRESVLARILADNGVRFPKQKAARLKAGASRNFERIASAARDVLRSKHDVGARRSLLRTAELGLAVLIQQELAACGGGPKIARLILKLPHGEFDQVVPIDSRWIGALATVGVDIDPTLLSREATYRLVEDQIVRAAHSLRIQPLFADGVVFGWLGQGEDEQ